MNNDDKRRIKDAIWVLQQYEYEIQEIMKDSNYKHLIYDFKYFLDELYELSDKI